MKRLLFLLCFGTALQKSLWAQSADEKKVRTELMKLVQAIHKEGYGSATPEANEALETYLLTLTDQYPQIMRWKFAGVDSSGLVAISSSDGRFRVWSWDTFTGGTMHHFAAVAHYASGANKANARSLTDEAKEAEEGDPGVEYGQVYAITRKGKSTVYLVKTHGIYSGIERSAGIRAFSIEGGKLKVDYPFFFTPSRSYGALQFYFNRGKLTGTKWEKAYPEITLSADRRKLTVPVATEDGKVTARVLTYVYDGEKFVWKK